MTQLASPRESRPLLQAHASSKITIQSSLKPRTHARTHTDTHTYTGTMNRQDFPQAHNQTLMGGHSPQYSYSVMGNQSLWECHFTAYTDNYTTRHVKKAGKMGKYI